MINLVGTNTTNRVKLVVGLPDYQKFVDLNDIQYLKYTPDPEHPVLSINGAPWGEWEYDSVTP